MKLNPSEIAILRSIQQSDGISRKALAEKNNLSQASITKITKMLVEQGFILEGDRIGEGLGRKEVLLSSNPNKFRFLGIDIGGYRLRLAIANYTFEITHYKEFLMEEIDIREDVLEQLIPRIELFLQESQVSSVDAIGVSVTGIIDIDRKSILDIPNITGWNSIPITERLSSFFSCPVFLEESGRAMAIAEKVLGKAKDKEDFIFVHIAYGVVAGIFIHGSPLRGINNVAGLLGHITVDEEAGQCRCGNYGCLENIVTYPMIESRYQEKDQTTTPIAKAYQINNKNALETCISSGEAVGVALSNVINLFNPEVIYVGGPIFDRFPILFEEVNRTILLRANRFATVGMKLEKSSFGDKQGVLGSIALAENSYIS